MKAIEQYLIAVLFVFRLKNKVRLVFRFFAMFGVQD